MPSDIDPIGKSRDCTIYPEGIIAFSQPVISVVGWQAGHEITISTVRELPLCFLFRRASHDGRGYILSFLNKANIGGSGGKLTCRRIIGTMVHPAIALPLRNIQPVYLEIDRKLGLKPYQMAFLLAEPRWTAIEFNALGADGVPSRLSGVYQVLGGDDKVLRVGQGFIQSRMRENLKIGDLRAARRFLYFPLSNKEDMLLLEHILLQRHKQENGGQLPPGNRITA